VKGSLATLVLGGIVYVLATTGFGLLISVFVSTQTAAIFAAAIITILPAVQFSGMFVPVSSLTEMRVIVGTAALFAAVAVFALAMGTLLRRSAATVTVVIVAVVLPYIFAVGSVLPAGVSEWLTRLTPAAAFAVQQSLVAYPQVTASYTPGEGYFPLSPWAGFAVLCGYALLALGLAHLRLSRRDA